MKKKIIIALVAAIMFGSTSAFAKTGVGAQFGYTVGGGAGGALTLKVDKLPCVFAIDLGLGTGYFGAGVTADWWIANPPIIDTWGFYYGVGVGVGFGIWDGGGFSFNVGPRAVIGTNIFLINKFLEFYLQAAWQPTLVIGGSGNSGGIGFNWLSIPVNLGFRFWF